ncbi:MAG: ankyrin repeat domain-containing protein [Methanoregula sp.]|nr:ankyrin repeat domain-containing protein [Methanoregula sp.]
MSSRRQDLQLMDAVETGDLELVRQFLQRGADVNTRGPHGETPLIKSMLCDDPRICTLLLDSGADANLTTTNGYSPLVFASLQNNSEYVQTLLRYRANVGQRTEDGWTPLLISATNPMIFYNNMDHEFYKHLIGIIYKYARYRPDYNPVRTVSLLLSAKANPNESTMFGTTCLMAAASMANYEILNVLLAEKTAVDLADTEGKTALMYAVISTIEELIESLIHLRLVSSTIKLTDFMTPQMLAQLKPQFEPQKELCVNFLIENGADIRVRDKKGIPVLAHAARTGNLNVVKNLVSHGASVHDKSPRGITPLYAAAINGHTGIAEFLLSQGANVDERLSDGETPLMAAVWNGQVGTVDLLLRHGANVHAKKATPYRESGDSSLVWAVHRHRKEKNENYDLIFRMLADAGAE